MAGPSLGEDKVFLYLSHYRRSGGNKCFGIIVLYPHFFGLYKKGFEKYVYMSYTMRVHGKCAKLIDTKGRMNYGIITGMAEDCL